MRVEIGEREVNNGELTLTRRDLGKESKVTLSVDAFLGQVQAILDEVHETMLARQRQFTADNTNDVKHVQDIKDFFAADGVGFTRAPISILGEESLQSVMQEHGLSTRNMPFEDEGQKVLIAKAY